MSGPAEAWLEEGLVLKWPEVIPRKDYGRVIRQVLVMADMVRDVGRAPRATKPAEEEPAEPEEAPTVRDFSVVPRIRELLQSGPMQTSAIMKALGLGRSRVRSALKRMNAKLVEREGGRGGEGTYALSGKVGPRRLPGKKGEGSIPARVKALLEKGDFTSAEMAGRLGESVHSVQCVVRDVGARKAGGDGTPKSPTVWSLRAGKPGPKPGYKVRTSGEGMAEIERLLRAQHLTTASLGKLAGVSPTYALRVAKKLGAVRAGEANDGRQLWHLNGVPTKSEATA